MLSTAVVVVGFIAGLRCWEDSNVIVFSTADKCRYVESPFSSSSPPPPTLFLELPPINVAI
eukprot:CAMPEP_0181063124 /NCGR_PEP_ID=MMETSP1070-20121207/23468_1 /TAXON_ID=265543 /ORGANISM="Minutocellus polymorphus, Strain NH13" /LENGTH=60 /DNA_ID=CAMNT_0023143287 /DNA_START=58 /DNA_END=237 /DNA_ORIENTATION=+